MPGPSSYGVTEAGFFPKPVSVIISDFEAAQQAAIAADIDTSPDMPLGQLNGIYATAHGQLWELAQTCYNAFNRSAAEGNQLDNVGTLTGSLRLPPKPSYALCTCNFSATGTYAAGSLVAYPTGLASNLFSNAQDVVVTATGNLANVVFTSQADGVVDAPAGTLVNINAAVSGWVSVTNPLDAVAGNLIEDDADYRLRQEQELSAAGSGTYEGMTADLLEVPGVINATVYENETNIPDSTGLPGHAFECVVFDGVTPGAADADIGTVINNDRPLGVQAYGLSSVQITDELGNLQTVYFTRPQQLTLYCKFTVTLASGYILGNVAPQIKQLVVDYCNANLKPGSEVYALSLQSLALQVPGVLDVPTFKLDFITNPTNQSNLVITGRQIAVADTGRITVNGV